MTAYADSGVLAKLYVLEPDSPEAVHLVSSFAPPLPLTHLQALEVRNALRLKAFRGEMTRTQLRRTLLRLTDDIPQGRGAVGKACSQYGVPQCRYSARRRSSCSRCPHLPDFRHAAGEARSEGSTEGAPRHHVVARTDGVLTSVARAADESA